MRKFKPAFGLKNRHFQTLYSALFRKAEPLHVEVETYTLEDGDFLECHWSNKPKDDSNRPIVILFHGLAGSGKSPYIVGVMQELKKNGFASVIMHFRGCSGKENKLPRSYHSGDSGDALSWIKTVASRFPNSKLFGVGYSLGGNMLLKLLGEKADKSPLVAAVSVSAPLQLDICADAMNRGFSKLYQHILLKDLNLSLEKKFDKHDMSKYVNIKKNDVKNLKTFWDFDEAYTAPVHGFTSAQDYYTRCSSRQFLKDIRTPTLIIHAEDDPFMTTDILPTQEELSKTVKFELSAYGGHVGFIGGTFFKPDYWLEKRVVEYFKSFI
jgi:predicted alpha/beta-fold hydrolase